jgi:hypothetical protein
VVDIFFGDTKLVKLMGNNNVIVKTKSKWDITFSLAMTVFKILTTRFLAQSIPANATLLAASLITLGRSLFHCNKILDMQTLLASALGFNLLLCSFQQLSTGYV